MAIPKKPLPSADAVRELLHYCPETGLLTWKVDRAGTARAGTVAGAKGKCAIALNFSRSWGRLLAHRVIWLMVTGDDPGAFEVDHADGDPHNNKWENLRLADRSNNCANKVAVGRQGLPKGVIYARRCIARPFQARLQYRENGKTVSQSLGFFETADEAHQAYMKAALNRWGQFACGGVR